MAKFNKIETIKGKISGVVIRDGSFVDSESGEVIDVTKMLSQVYGDEPFDISTNAKQDVELDTK